jgi:hypothetical protein
MEVPAAAIVEVPDAAAAAQSAERAARRSISSGRMKHLKPRERSMLWLAYAQGWSHEEIASAIGVKTASMKAMLHRARQRLVRCSSRENDHDRLRLPRSSEQDVVNAVLGGTWPDRCDDSLVSHAAHCVTCREVAQVSMLLHEDVDHARIDVIVPAAGQIWWRAAVRARLESTHAAARPMSWMHAITGAIVSVCSWRRSPRCGRCCRASST